MQMVLDLGSLRTVAGVVTAADPSQKVQTGSVTVTDATDATQTFRSKVNEDGKFSIPYVPPGTYTLTVSYASTLQARGRNGQPQTCQPFSMTLTVNSTDVSGLTLVLASGQ